MQHTDTRHTEHHQDSHKYAIFESAIFKHQNVTKACRIPKGDICIKS